MKKSLLTTLAFLPALALAGMPMMGGPRPGMMHGGMMKMSMVRHQLMMRQGLDPAYRGTRNPLPDTPEIRAQGETLFKANCAACHGDQGHGDGPAAKGLQPPPADLTRLMKMPMASDAYLLWTISEGGQPVGSAMPAFKESLSREEIWKIVRYLRTL